MIIEVTGSRGPAAGHSGFVAGIRSGLVPQRFVHRRPRRLQKKPPPPNKSTSTTIMRSVSVDIYTDLTPGHDFAKWGVHPTNRLKLTTPHPIAEMAGRHHVSAPVQLAHNLSKPCAQSGYPPEITAEKRRPAGEGAFATSWAGRVLPHLPRAGSVRR
jgi:hypothetical protein